MKRLVMYLCAGLLLVSCASLPDPGGPNSSLVVGNLVIDFPDGFFDIAPTTLDSQVKLTFTDLDNNTKQSVYTKQGGYYYFVGEPGHRYVFESWDASFSRGHHSYSLGPSKVGGMFTAAPGEVTYLGDIAVIFTAPDKTSQVGTSSQWHYKSEFKFNLKPQGVTDFLSEFEGTPWLDYKVVPARLESQSAK